MQGSSSALPLGSRLSSPWKRRVEDVEDLGDSPTGPRSLPERDGRSLERHPRRSAWLWPGLGSFGLLRGSPGVAGTQDGLLNWVAVLEFL